MDPNELPANSVTAKKVTPIRAADDEKKIERVTTSEPVLIKRSIGKTVGRRVRDAVGGVVTEILIPAAQDMFIDAAIQGVERTVRGEVSSTRRSSSHRGRTNYREASTRRDSRDDPRAPSYRARANFDFTDYKLATRVEAETVLDRLFALIQKYDTATVADLYELIGVTPNYTDNKYGWTDIRDADIARVRDGYVLDLPRPEPLT